MFIENLYCTLLITIHSLYSICYKLQRTILIFVNAF